VYSRDEFQRIYSTRTAGLAHNLNWSYPLAKTKRVKTTLTAQAEADLTKIPLASREDENISTSAECSELTKEGPEADTFLTEQNRESISNAVKQHIRSVGYIR
jgi:hypothetical protein